MPIERQVCSFDLAKQLQALGMMQASVFYWRVRHGEAKIAYANGLTPKPHCSAFTVAELDRAIILVTKGDYVCLDHEDGSMGYRVDRRLSSNGLIVIGGGLTLHILSNPEIMDESAANCRAKMLVHLLGKQHGRP